MKHCLSNMLQTGRLRAIHNSFKSIMLLVLFIFLLSASVFAQQRTISGRVTNAENRPLPLATVSVKGKSTSVTTNENGVFSIEAATGDVLVISSAEYKAEELPVGEGNT